MVRFYCTYVLSTLCFKGGFSLFFLIGNHGSINNGPSKTVDDEVAMLRRVLNVMLEVLNRKSASCAPIENAVIPFGQPNLVRSIYITF